MCIDTYLLRARHHAHHDNDGEAHPNNDQEPGDVPEERLVNKFVEAHIGTSSIVGFV